MANQPRQPQERRGSQAGQKDQGRQAPHPEEHGNRDTQPSPRHGQGRWSEETPGREPEGERYPSQELSADDDDL